MFIGAGTWRLENKHLPACLRLCLPSVDSFRALEAEAAVEHPIESASDKRDYCHNAKPVKIAKSNRVFVR